MWIAAECEVKDLRELATRELPEVMLPVEASAIDRLEDLLRFMLYGPWRDEAPQEVEEYLWKLERRWNSMWRRLHSTPLANGTNPPPAEANAAEGGKPGTVAKPESPADPFAELRQFARTELKGQERAVIEALCDAAGELPLTDVKALCNWQDPIESAWNSLRMRTNKKLELQGWKVITRGRSARLTKPDPE